MIRDLLLLARAPLAASALSNMALGLFLAWGGGSWQPRHTVATAFLALATGAFYWAGMVLNDWFDRGRDARLHPGRPIPSGRVDPAIALVLGLSLLAVGLTAAALAGPWAGQGVSGGLLGGGLVAASVLAYDGWLKRYRLVGSAAMATCRLTNVLMPALAFGLAPGSSLLLYAGLLFLYVFGLTIISTFEDEDGSGLWLAAASAVCLSAPAAVATLALAPEGSAWALVGALPLAAVILLQLLRTMERGTRARGAHHTRALLKSVWLVDLGVLLLVGAAALLPLWAGLWALGKASATLLFRPPPGPPSPTRA